jgi:8-oxo-dGTP pyrophosphatase MutT (NUDIX family)
VRWKTISEREVIANQWFTLSRADVELPDGRHLDHYLLRQPPVAIAAVLNADERVLLIWRHRFIPDSWGWELPSGKVDDGEDIAAAAVRETREETGWEPAGLHHLMTLEVSAGFSDARHHIYWTDRAAYTGAPIDAHESDAVDWLPLSDVPDLIAKGEIKAAHTAAALLTLLQRRDTNGSAGSALSTREASAGHDQPSPRPHH